MKPILFLTAIILLTSCKKEYIKGSGATITSERQVPAFTKVSLEGSGHVSITHGAVQQVKVTGYENLVPVYETNVVNGKLILKFRNDYNVRNSNISVSIVVPAIKGVAINGSGEIYSQQFTGTSFEADINGSGKIELKNSVYANVYYKVNGSGNIYGGQLQSVDADANISGSGQIDVYATGKLKARISGSGLINYWGNPSEVDTQVSGSGRVVKR